MHLALTKISYGGENISSQNGYVAILLQVKFPFLERKSYKG